jgi:ribonuclease G
MFKNTLKLQTEKTVKKEIIVNRTFEESRVAVLEDGKLFNLFIERRESEKILNNIYKGRVQNVVPALSSAFVDIGFGRSAYLDIADIVKLQSGKKNIKDVIEFGQDIMVQVYKEPICNKGAKVTMDISLPGRLLVYMPFSNNVGVSKSIKDKHEHNRLKSMAMELKKDIPGGIIIRTEAEEATETGIKNEIKYLTRLWASIIERFNSVKPMSLVHKDLGLVFQTIRDYFSDDVEFIRIDSQKELKDVTDFVKIISPEFLDKIVFYDIKTPIFKKYNIEGEIKKLCSNKVWLNSGGYLIIQEAESLCAIDVNSGRFTAKATREDTAVITNLEAAEEIARQLRLRNIGGIIVIDFIDMKIASNRKKVLKKLCEATKVDKAKIEICPITKLGLIEMTRERKRKSLFSLLGDTCSVCHGLGIVPSKESIFVGICNEINQLKIDGYKGKIKIKLNVDVVEYFMKRKERLKGLFGIVFDIEASAEILREEYKIILE